ncbi:MAG TPA: NPCBM/NEW2 domain-containing protein [Armatimonadota bacterium]|nr:NPCBM/NEW2 domain-containing protein [Armatimonadota bacterium]
MVRLFGRFNPSAMAALCLLAALTLAVRCPAIPQETRVPDSSQPPENGIWLDGLDVRKLCQDNGTARAGRSVDNNPLKLSGTGYSHGIGTWANSLWIIDLKRSAEKFSALVGVDDEANGKGSVIFEVVVDGKTAARTDVLRGGDQPQPLAVDLRGAKRMMLLVRDAGDDIEWDHADWADAVLYLSAGAKAEPEAVARPVEPPMRIASGVSDKPSINGPRFVGATPGNPFLFLIPATGKGSLKYSAKNLPAGLALDSDTGIIAGSLREPGTTVVRLTVKGPAGIAERSLVVVGGRRKLALTPPMGWNSWNVWGGSVDGQMVRDAADWMVKSGLAAHGYQYINVDDGWSGERDENGEMRGNEKFGDMKALADYVHSKGLKFGIYSSPGPKTCQGYPASYGHEEQDAQTWANWGVDYLKYDWCSYGNVATGEGLERLQKPFRVMREALDKCGRDIVYSVCQYGMGNAWEWAAEVGGNLWRTTGDINDTWFIMSLFGFRLDGFEKYAGPGHWNDPDMLVVGRLGGGPNLHNTNLMRTEQITHITLWSLLAAPLLLGCDLSQLDQFTLDLLTNDEVIAVNQDPLGLAAGRRAWVDQTEVWARPLWDGTMAVGLFNRGIEKMKVTAKWSDLGLEGKQPVRDLWRKRDLGGFDKSFTVEVPSHGAVLVKIGTPKR